MNLKEKMEFGHYLLTQNGCYSPQQAEHSDWLEEVRTFLFKEGSEDVSGTVPAMDEKELVLELKKLLGIKEPVIKYTEEGRHTLHIGLNVSEEVGYHSISKLKIDGVWYLGFTPEWRGKEMILNTKDDLDKIIETI